MILASVSHNLPVLVFLTVVVFFVSYPWERH